MARTTNFAFSADPSEFMAAQQKADEIAAQYPGMSRSMIWKTLIMEGLGVKPVNPDLHALYLTRVNKALGRK